LSVDAAPGPRSFRIRLVGADGDIACSPDQDVLNAAIRDVTTSGTPELVPS
jgi:hypothetical protein